MPKRMSAKQIAANRANARKSTGPKTKQGRAVSKLNALKHGILSKEVLVRGLNVRESGREYLSLHQRFVDELQPVGPVEEMLVNQIVTAHWRSRRALMAESGEIALSVDEGERKRTSNGMNPTLLWLHWGSPIGDAFWKMQETAVGNQVLESWLRETRKAVEREGELTEAATQKLVEALGGNPNSLANQLERFRLGLKENPEGLEGEALREWAKARTLAYLDDRITDCTWQRKKCKEREKSEEQARQAAAVLPSMETLDKIMRYESRLERQMFRAMAQLERLQRLRQGEDVPPPMSVVMTERA